MVTQGTLKTKENRKLPSLKVVAAAYEKWLLTRGSNYSHSTGETLVFWKSGCLREVVTRGGSTVAYSSTTHMLINFFSLQI